MDLQLGPLGYKGSSGIEELQNLLQVSQPTTSAEIRQVVVPVPPGYPEQTVDDLPGSIAVIEFFLIRSQSFLPPPPPQEQPDLSQEGQIGKLPGGGKLRLRLHSTQAREAATLDILDRRIAGYEQVKQIQFVLPPDPTPLPREYPEVERRVPPSPLPLPPETDQIQVLTEAQFQAQAEPTLGRIFLSDDLTYPEMIAPAVLSRKIIYEYYYHLDSPLLEAVVAAASSLGDTGCYLTMLLRVPRLRPEEPNHWYIPFSQISAYQQQDALFGNVFALENVLYSAQGKWGIMLNPEGFGLLCGSCEFMQGVSRLFPDLDQQVYQFLSYWRSYKTEGFRVETDWIASLLTQVYGQEVAEKMLQAAGLP